MQWGKFFKNIFIRLLIVNLKINTKILFLEPPVKKISNKPSEQPKTLVTSTQIHHQQSSKNVSEIQKNTSNSPMANGLSQNNSQLFDSIPFSEFTQETQTNHKQDLSKKINNVSDSRALESRCRSEIKKMDKKQKRTVDELLEDVSALLSGENLENSYLFEPGMLDSYKEISNRE